MSDNPHFLFPATWEEAAELVTFPPLRPGRAGGFALNRLAVFVRDHRMREMAPEDRSLEAYYGGFVFSQTRKVDGKARHAALELSYGAGGYEVRIVGREGRAYELGPEVPPNDIDGRCSAVVTWFEDEMFYLLGSDELEAITLIEIATAMYAPGG